MTWDVAVIGSGPAGAAAAMGALQADPAASVLLLDRSDFPRDKCCGDAVLVGALDELAGCGLDVADVLRGYPRLRRLRMVTTAGIPVDGDLPGEMSVVPRRVLDHRLRDAALAAGAQWRRHTVKVVADRGDHVDVDGIRARVVIGADGAESIVRRAVDPGDRRELAIALRGYETAASDQVPVLLFDPRGKLGYAWRFPTPGGANVGFGHVLAAGEKASRADLLAGLRRLLPDAHPEPSSVRAHRLPLATRTQPVARGRLLLAGDAAGLVNPLSGEGIYYAIVSGRMAGAAAVGADRPARSYRTALRRRFGMHHAQAAVLSTLIRRPAIVDAGVRAAGARPAAFGDLASIGLRDGTLTPRLAGGLVWQLLRDVWD